MPDLKLVATTVDLDTGEIRSVDGPGAVLTKTERALLRFLAEHPGEVLGREVLLQAVWGYTAGVRSRTLDTAIKVLRKKVERDPVQPDHVVTVRGVGYRFDPVPEAGVAPIVGAWFGRAEELATVGAAFDAGVRLVTVRGPGGIGKSRLARELLRTRPGLVVELTFAGDGPSVVAAVARALGPDVALKDGAAVGARLRVMRVALLCLDGCEAAVDAVRAEVGPWLAAAPGTAFLVTSRVALGLDGERIVDLGGLPEDAAIALLVDRGTRRRRSFADSPRTALVRIVNAVDRVPLALELVGARAGLLGAPALADRLGTLDWLESSSGSLRATVAWSWDLLPPDAQTVLAACGVFAGGFVAAAAEAVAGPLVGGRVLEVLEILRDTSLLTLDEDGMRLDLYVMVRVFVAPRITDPEGCEDRLADWLVATLHDAPSDRLLAEMDNLRVAVRAVAVRRPAVAAGLAALLERALASTGPSAARLEAAVLAVSCAERAGTDVLLARAYLARARAAEIAAAPGIDADLQTARIHAERDGDPELRGQVLAGIGAVALGRGALPEAESAYTEAIPLLADRRTLADAWSNLGQVAMLQGDHERSVDLLKRGLALQEEAGNAVHAAKVLGTLGIVYQRTGNLERARRFWREALRRHEAAGHRPGVLRMVGNLAVAEHALGRLEEAAASFERTATLARELGEPLIEGIVYLNVAAVLLEGGDDIRAEAHLARARALLTRMGARLYLARVTLWDGVVAAIAGDHTLASRRVAEADRELEAVGDRPVWIRARGLAVAAFGASTDQAAVLALADADPNPLGARWLRLAVALRQARSAAERTAVHEDLAVFRETDAREETDLRIFARVVSDLADPVG